MPSAQRTTTAVLRLATGLSAEEFAQLIGKSLPTVRSLEAGKLALSERTAAVISAKTGISLKWLLAGDVAAPMTDDEGKAWTIETYDLVKHDLPTTEVLQVRNKDLVDSLILRLRSLKKERAIPAEDFYITLNSIDRTLDHLENYYLRPSPRGKSKK